MKVRENRERAGCRDHQVLDHGRNSRDGIEVERDMRVAVEVE